MYLQQAYAQFYLLLNFPPEKYNSSSFTKRNDIHSKTAKLQPYAKQQGERSCEIQMTANGRSVVKVLLVLIHSEAGVRKHKLT